MRKVFGAMGVLGIVTSAILLFARAVPVMAAGASTAAVVMPRAVMSFARIL